MENRTKAFLIAGLLFLSRTVIAQERPSDGLRSVGACARCHVNAVLEWDVSKHSKIDLSCTGCHGTSKGHVLDERNTVKPDRIPRQGAIAGLCQTCHQSCPSTQLQSGCQTCHHVHALVDLRKKPDAKVPSREEKTTQRNLVYRQALEAGENLARQGRWKQAIEQFERALEARARDELATRRIAFCRRRLNPGLPGFRALTVEFDPDTGLPLQVELTTLKLKMVLVPGGVCDIGDETLPDARPVHTVQIAPSYLGQQEVTQEQWQQVLGSNSNRDKEVLSFNRRMPVQNVSWEDCQLFVKRLNEQIEGAGFRLPSEAEWEHAARADAMAAALEARAWHHANSPSAPQPGGGKQASALGIYDMEGNVWEWCSSLFRPYLYDPLDGRENPGSPGLRVLRGGSYRETPDILRVGLRYGERPGRRFPWNGLRLARSIPSIAPLKGQQSKTAQ
jgi:formylglycine-generating enzyme required for sulfatase activity